MTTEWQPESDERPVSAVPDEVSVGDDRSEADAIEQQLPADSDGDTESELVLGPETPEADAVEQHTVVPDGDERDRD